MEAALYCRNCGTPLIRGTNFCSKCGMSQADSTPDFITVKQLDFPPFSTGKLPVTTLLHQRYRLISIIGSGGMGAVYLALDTQLGDRPVALKEMSTSHVSPKDIPLATELFRREAHLLAGLHHPHLPAIHEYFIENGRWYLVMSFIEGQNLQTVLNATVGKRLSVDEVVRIGIELCEVLEYLHTHEPPIIFRDLKPANIMMTPEGHVCLIDFGIARNFKQGQNIDTALFFSAGYAPPEQYGQSQTSPRSDIYSLGATLHQMLTGHDPATNTPTPFDFPPLQLSDHIASADLGNLIGQMLEKDPGKRPPDMAHVRQRLQQIATQRAVLPTDQRAASAAITEPASLAYQSEGKRGISRRWLLVGLATLIGAGGGVVAWHIAAQSASTTPPLAPRNPSRVTGKKPPVSHTMLEVAFSTSDTGNLLFTTSSPDGVTWPTAVQAQSQVRLQGSPAMAAFKNKLYIALRSNDPRNLLFITASADGQSWPHANSYGITLQDNPTMAVFNNQLYIAFRANDASNTLFVTSSADGQNWPAATQQSNIQLQGSPAIAAFNNQLFVALRSNDPRNLLFISSSADGQTWPTATSFGVTLQESPAMAVFNNQLYIAFQSNDGSNTLSIISSTDGQNWSTPVQSNILLQGSPAMTVFDNKLYIAVRANDASNALYVTSTTDGQHWSEIKQFGISLQDDPAIASFST